MSSTSIPSLTAEQAADRVEWLSGAAGRELQTARDHWETVEVLDRIKQAAEQVAKFHRHGPADAPPAPPRDKGDHPLTRIRAIVDGKDVYPAESRPGAFAAAQVNAINDVLNSVGVRSADPPALAPGDDVVVHDPFFGDLPGRVRTVTADLIYIEGPQLPGDSRSWTWTVTRASAARTVTKVGV